MYMTTDPKMYLFCNGTRKLKRNSDYEMMIMRFKFTFTIYTFARSMNATIHRLRK